MTSPVAPSEAAATGAPLLPPAYRPWNPLAIVGFVLAFVVPPGAIACGHIAMSQVRRTGEQGYGLALAAAVLGWVFTVGVALLVVLWFLLLATSLLIPLIAIAASR